MDTTVQTKTQEVLQRFVIENPDIHEGCGIRRLSAQTQLLLGGCLEIIDLPQRIPTIIAARAWMDQDHLPPEEEWNTIRYRDRKDIEAFIALCDVETEKLRLTDIVLRLLRIARYARKAT